jgi:hypothetical protein
VTVSFKGLRVWSRVTVSGSLLKESAQSRNNVIPGAKNLPPECLNPGRASSQLRIITEISAFCDNDLSSNRRPGESRDPERPGFRRTPE